MPKQLHFDPNDFNVALAEPLLSATEAARLLSVRPSWVHAAARSGELPCVRLGKHVRFLRSDLERWVAQHRQGRSLRPESP